MKTGPVNQVLQSFFGVERRDTITRFLYTIIMSVIVLDTIMIVNRRWDASSATTTTPALIVLLVLQFVLLVLVRRGYVEQAAYTLVIGSWLMATYLIWSADGIRDVTLYLYFVILVTAALITDWQLIFILALLSISFIWLLAIAEFQGLRAAHFDAPLSLARDLTAIFVLLVILIYLVVNSVARSLDAVREGEKKFRKVFHVSPVAISISTLGESRLVDANDAFFNLTGYERESAIGESTLKLGIWQNEGELAGFTARLLEQKSLQNPDFKFTSVTGQERTALAFYELIDVENKPAVLSMLYDITEQRKAQMALQASERKYRLFVEQSIEGIWYLAFDQPIPTGLPVKDQVELIYKWGYIAECNEIIAQIYGYPSSGDLIGVHLVELQAGGPIFSTNNQVIWKLVQDNYRSANVESMETDRHGQTVYFLNNSVGIIQGDCLVGLWGTKLDISILKYTEEALRHSEARMRALLNAVPDMIFELDREGRILQFIPSTINAPLLPPEQFIGRTLAEVLPSVSDQTEFAISRSLESGDVSAFQYELYQDGKQRTFEARITPVGPDTVLAMVRDVSLQKWIEEEREKLIAELEQKNVELERFTYTVSHDLKSPLITIRGFLGFIQEDSRKGNLARLDSDIKRISAATEKMQALLNDLLELSRVGRLLNEPRNINFNDLVKETLELLHGRISQSGVAVSVQDNLPTVRGDYDRLLEVLQNLIDNACKFMKDQGAPQIEIGYEGFDEGMPVFYVRDNGIGIPPQFHDNIFGLFNKLDIHSEGTGVGLTLVKRIIEFHGGRIWIQSEADRGTTFFFTLPTPP